MAGDGLVYIFNWAVNKVQGFFYGLAAGALDVMYSIAVGAEGFAGGFMKVMARAIQWVIDKFNSLVDMLSNIPFFDTLGISKVKVDIEEPETPHGASDIIAKYRQGLEVYKPADKVVFELSKQRDYKDTKSGFWQGESNRNEWYEQIHGQGTTNGGYGQGVYYP
ncbi:hypothetical protein ACFSQ7_06680 [Paenibacillus rhizoplanae]